MKGETESKELIEAQHDQAKRASSAAGGSVPLHELDDEELVRRLGEGETEMLGQLYVRHEKLVGRALRRSAPEIPDAQVEELTQDVQRRVDQHTRITSTVSHFLIKRVFIGGGFLSAGCVK